MTQLTSNSLDKFAVFLSGVCVVHCLLTPIILTLLPVVAASVFIEDVLFHQAILWLVLPSSCIALFIGCRKHKDLLIAGSGVLGMLLLVFIAFFAHDLLTPVQEKIATSMAGLILAYSHIRNYKACQTLTCGDDNCSAEHHH
jgi:hypothetical protein